MSKASKACDISPKVRKLVKERDNSKCIICGSVFQIEIAHIFIPRSKMGLGVKENLACMCSIDHKILDNGLISEGALEIKSKAEMYLRSHYDINTNDLKYNKWSGFQYE